MMALFLLVYTGADILCPQYCCEEMLGLYQVVAISVAPADDGAITSLVIESQGSRQDQNSGAIPGDEDCFCRSSVLTSASHSAHLAGVQAEVPWLSLYRLLRHPSLLSEASLAFHDPPTPSASPLLLNKSIRC
jgi:hypothetical protein